MSQNDLNPPPPKVPHKYSNQMQQMITMTADDATLDVIIWIHDFPSQNPF